MPAVTLRAHYDGKRILLDEPFDIPPNTPLMVTVLASAEADPAAADWSAIAGEALVRAYGDDEPDYTDADLRP